MRKEIILFLSFLVDAGYIMSFRVTKDKIFIGVGAANRARRKRDRNDVIKNLRWIAAKKVNLPGNGAEIMKPPLCIKFSAGHCRGRCSAGTVDKETGATV